MITYRDMTFCKERSCAKFGPCFRSLTDEVREGSEKAKLPICQWKDRPECYEEKS